MRATSAITRAARPIAPVVAGDGLLHPLALFAITVFIVNDHVLKAALPGPISGKLSDLAGLLFFPLFLQAAVEVGASALRASLVANRNVLLVATVSTGIVFAAVKLLPSAADVYEIVLGAAQWMLGIVPALMAGSPLVEPRPVMLVSDPTDLVALPVLIATYVIGAQRTRSASQQN